MNLGNYESALHMLAEALMDQFEGSEAVNYIEQTFSNKENPSKSFVLTMQMTDGITPCQKLEDKQREVDELKAMVNNPMQPIIDGRFKENKIVRYCLENNTDMNDIARQDFSDDDQMQFAQLIGYSIGGYGDLSYVTDESYYRAQNRHCLGEHDKRVIKKAFMHAWNLSGEGFNSEYGVSDERISKMFAEYINQLGDKS
jgi:hypothetical protein